METLPLALAAFLAIVAAALATLVWWARRTHQLVQEARARDETNRDLAEPWGDQ